MMQHGKNPIAQAQPVMLANAPRSIISMYARKTWINAKSDSQISINILNLISLIV
jgi:hypothetical protein